MNDLNKKIMYDKSSSRSNQDSKYLLMDSPWPCFRGSANLSGRSIYQGSSLEKIVFEVNIGKPSGEPTIDNHGTIYVPIQDKEIVAIDKDGVEIWRRNILGAKGRHLRWVTTPALRNDGSIITSAMRKVVSFSPEGKIIWEKTIDGVPQPPLINQEGIIYVSAHSIDWAGIYLIDPKGNSYGKDDPRIRKEWRINKRVEITPVAIDKFSNISLAFRANVTDSESYTWVENDKDCEEFHYECVTFDKTGELISRFIPEDHQTGRIYPSSVSINNTNDIFYIGSHLGTLFVFSLQKMVKILPKITDDVNFGNSLKPRDERIKRDNIISETWKSLNWGWDSAKGEHLENSELSVKGLEPVGYPAHELNSNKVWIRLNRSKKLFDDPKIYPSGAIKGSERMICIDYSKGHCEENLYPYSFNLNSSITTNPIIDRENNIFVGTDKGRIYKIFSKNYSNMSYIDIGKPISYIIIGENNSIIVLTEEGSVIKIK